MGSSPGSAVIAITALEGEIVVLCGEHGCGIVVAPVTALRWLQRCASSAPQAVVAMGWRTRVMLDAEFTRK